jgi:hypothetical protein
LEIDPHHEQEAAPRLKEKVRRGGEERRARREKDV